MHRRLRTAFMTLLETFADRHENGLNHPDFRRVLLDVSKFSLNHLNPWLEQADIEREMPKVVWYGDATKSQLYFLYYLMLIGCDVLLFHPAAEDPFSLIDPDEELSFVIKLPQQAVLSLFRKKSRTERPRRPTGQRKKLSMC